MSADQALDVEPVLDEILGQRGEQLFVRSRVGGAHVIHRVDQAAAHEVGPHAVHYGPREVRVLWAESASWRNAARRSSGRIERQACRRAASGGSGSQQPRMIDVARMPWRTPRTSPGSAPFFTPDPREQIGDLVILLLGPLLERMVVAARAGDALAQNACVRVLGEVDGILVQRRNSSARRSAACCPKSGEDLVARTGPTACSASTLSRIQL